MVSRNLCRLPRYTETVVSRVLQVWGRYLPSEPYRHRPHLGFPTAGDARSGRIICSWLYAGSLGVPFARPVGRTVGYSGGV